MTANMWVWVLMAACSTSCAGAGYCYGLLAGRRSASVSVELRFDEQAFVASMQRAEGGPR